ncbi:MAG: TetR/AcrR family transcriptional regulator [Phycisphaeraceae bacterium]
MRYDTDHKRHTREEILAAAARQFRERGFDRASVGSIMKEAGLTHGGFYAHFESKDDLIANVISGGFDHVTERFEQQFNHLQGEDWLKQWVQRYLSDTHYRATDLGCPMPALAGEIARSGERACRAFTELFEERMQRVMSHVDAPTEEARRRVLAAVSQMTGAMMLARALDNALADDIRAAASACAVAVLTGRAIETVRNETETETKAASR